MTNEVEKALTWIGWMFVAIGVLVTALGGFPCSAMVGGLGLLMVGIGRLLREPNQPPNPW